ncbi:MAG: hypothetical protein J0H82_20480 [Alphaproteobacteria bacterium]|jgi:predicted small lipoprotein YifL|nr:hypothetical protein [Alphaproteobacteria bacterium]
MRRLGLFLILGLALAGLAGCGKKAENAPPQGASQTAPRVPPFDNSKVYP